MRLKLTCMVSVTQILHVHRNTGFASLSVRHFCTLIGTRVFPDCLSDPDVSQDAEARFLDIKQHSVITFERDDSKKNKKRRKNPKEKAHLHQRKKVFPISIMETLLDWVPLASL